MAENSFQNVLDRLSFLERITFAVLRFLLIAIIATMVIAVLAQVFSRYALDFSLTWSEELARICMIGLVFLGAAVLSRNNEHLSVTTIIELFPKRVYHLCVAMAQAVGIYCSWYLAQGAWAALGREWDQLTPALQIPFGLIYSTIFFAVVLMIFWLAINLVREVLIVTGKQDAIK
ncbi:TRAP transporter small permease [Roseibium porphyridii]|uniref:TRAP transporter small permease protein n=1 Tax=Roseibium porphyridii TaxID=2866279 RepID=A0ABY8F315_9HYPH|nr:TRAP transporter small permease [Roseibium sp. KMA01]WFE89861.1 TRAP transporter small permease [Roseibium sp. KMA01]